MKRALGILVVFSLLFCQLCFFAQADSGTIYVNGELFSGTLAGAITLAGQTPGGGTVGISGSVVIDVPIGYVDDTLITNVTIEGVNSPQTDSVALAPENYTYFYSKADIFTIMGTNVTIRNLTVDANWQVDFAIRLFNGCSNVLIENVIALGGSRGAVNILHNNNLTLKNVSANNGQQGGFYFDDVRDAAGITFVNCTTEDNFRAGVLIRNGYGPCMNLNLGGITCNENTFCVEDRSAGTIGGNGWADIEVKVPPKNAAGQPIRTDRAKYYPLESAYIHLRYGITDSELEGCEAMINNAMRYGMKSDLYFPLVKKALSDIRAGEELFFPPPTATLAARGTTVIDDKNGYITGLAPKLDSAKFEQLYVQTGGAAVMSYDCAGYIGTGTHVSLGDSTSPGQYLDIYEVIIYGDVDGDGRTNGSDAFLSKLLLSGMLAQEDFSAAALLAADANRDGVTDSNDVQLLRLAGVNAAVVSQV